MIKPELISVNAEVNKIMTGIRQKEAERKAAMEGAAKPEETPPPGALAGAGAGKAAAKEKTGYQLAGAAEIGSKEAFSAISRGMTAGKKDPAKDSLKVQKDSHAVLKSMDEKIGGLAGAMGAAIGGALNFAVK